MKAHIPTTYQWSWIVFLLVIALTFSLAAPAFAAQDDITVYDNIQTDQRDFVPGEVVYRFKNDSRRFRVMDVADVALATQMLERRSDIAYAEPNYTAHANYVPNDTYYSPYQWHFDNADYGGVGAEAAWDIARGNGTVVAVVDTGIAYEDYKVGRGWWGEEYDQAPDLANTCFEDGYDFVNNDSHANDDNSHGTHVAGTIAQSTGNGSGVAGLAHETCLMPVKVLDQNGGGTHTQVANGIYFAANNGADVINLSLGSAADSSTLKNAVQYAYEKGVTIVASSGNAGENQVGYPAAYDDYVIAVGATRYDEARAPYSNYGPSLDLVAPGGDTSVDQNGDGYGDGVLQQTFNPNTKNTSDFGYYFFQGTSMAAPHVSAAAAMLRGNGNASTPDEVRDALQSTAEDLGSSGRDDVYGYGLIDIPAALAWNGGTSEPPSEPDDAPSVTLSSPSDGATVSGVVTVSANASDDNGVDRVDFYIDDTLLGSDSTSPYEMTWNTASSSEGEHTVSATAVDTASQETTDAVTVTVDNVEDPNAAPTADAGPDQTIEDSDNNGSEAVSLDGSGSSDSDGSIVSYEWTEGGSLLATGATPNVTLDVGSHTLTLTVTDDDGATSSDNVGIEVTEPAPEPDISLTLSGDKDRGRHVVTLSWSGATSIDVDIYRGGGVIETTANDGEYIDHTRNRGSATYVYQICEAGTNTCSSEQDISF